VRQPWAGRVVAHVPLLREHEGERARLRGGELAALREHAGFLDHLRSGDSGQHPLSPLNVLGQDAAHGGWVEAVRPAQLRIPELAILEPGGPGALHPADEAVLARHRGLVAMRAEYQHFGVRGYRWGCGAARERDLLPCVGDTVLLDRSHRRVGRGLLVLGTRRTWKAEQQENRDA